MFNNKSIKGLLNNPSFTAKVAHRFPNAARGSISASLGLTGNTDEDLYKVASSLGAKSYILRRERAMINSGLLALSEVENG